MALLQANTSVSPSVVTDPMSPQITDLIPDKIQVYLDFLLYVFLAGLTAMLGVLTNVINILVYRRQGLNESSTISLLVLSVNDLGICFFTLLASTCILLDRILGKSSPVDLYSLSVAAGGIPREFFIHLSMRTTAVLSVERCFCVLRPMKVKQVFTRRNTIAILLMFYVDLAAMFVALFFTHTLRWQQDEASNSSKLAFYVTESGPTVENVHDTFNNMVITVLCIAIVLFCSFGMVSGVKASQKFRNTASTAASNETNSGKAGECSSPGEARLSAREARMVKLVTYISVIFLLSYVPYMSVSCAELIEPAMDYSASYNNLNNTLYGILYVIAAFNATVNILVYYTVSTNYKDTLLTLVFSQPTVDRKS